MRRVLNVVWFVLAGLWLAIGYAFAALLCFLLIITIPFGIAALRIAAYALWPFGSSVVKRADAASRAAIGNVLWVLLCGWWLALGHLADRPCAVSDDHRHPARHRELQARAGRLPAAGAGDRERRRRRIRAGGRVTELNGDPRAADTDRAMNDWTQRDFLVFEATGEPVPAYTCFFTEHTCIGHVRAEDEVAAAKVDRGRHRPRAQVRRRSR